MAGHELLSANLPQQIHTSESWIVDSLESRSRHVITVRNKMVDLKLCSSEEYILFHGHCYRSLQSMFCIMQNIRFVAVLPRMKKERFAEISARIEGSIILFAVCCVVRT